MNTCQVVTMGWRAVRRKRQSEDGRAWARVRWDRERAERLANPPMVDADTLRSRALFDRKGQLVLAGVAPALGRVEIYHSTARSDQFDVFVNGRKEVVGGPRILADWFKSIPSPCNS